MKLKYNDNFVNKFTGEVEERTQFGEFGNVWLCKTEIKNLQKFIDNYSNRPLIEYIEEIDEYIEYNKDEIPMSYFYIKSWIRRQVYG